MQAFAVSDRYLKSRAARDTPAALAQLALAQQPTPLSATETGYASTAWAWFRRFCDKETGFGPATALQKSLSPWEMGSTLIAILCAGRLGLISKPDSQRRLSLCLASLTRLPLEAAGLPAPRYDPASLHRLTENGALATGPTGWSAGAVMRLIASFIACAHHMPALAPEISIILNSWNLGDLLDKGRFQSAAPKPGEARPSRHPDLFLGYEQYAARAGCLVNLPCHDALDLRPILRGQRHHGLLLPGDKRGSARRIPAITSEPFCLEALEFGWLPDMLDIAITLYLAQKTRFSQTGILTALTEDALDQPPGFARHAVLAGNRPFTSLSRSGRDLSHLRCLSTKAAFCWWALLPSPYSQKLLDAITDLATADGWQAGVFEASGQPNTALSLNTNAVILEALHYRAFGPLFPA